MNIFKKIADYRTETERLAWTGTFAEYLEKLRDNPRLAMTAHARVYEMIASHGIVEENGHRKYQFF